jgi:hypothetical protein
MGVKNKQFSLPSQDTDRTVNLFCKGRTYFTQALSDYEIRFCFSERFFINDIDVASGSQEFHNHRVNFSPRHLARVKGRPDHLRLFSCLRGVFAFMSHSRNHAPCPELEERFSSAGQKRDNPHKLVLIFQRIKTCLAGVKEPCASNPVNTFF